VLNYFNGQNERSILQHSIPLKFKVMNTVVQIESVNFYWQKKQKYPTKKAPAKN
jgi:hypothetical protein